MVAETVPSREGLESPNFNLYSKIDSIIYDLATGLVLLPAPGSEEQRRKNQISYARLRQASIDLGSMISTDQEKLNEELRGLIGDRSHPSYEDFMAAAARLYPDHSPTGRATLECPVNAHLALVDAQVLIDRFCFDKPNLAPVDLAIKRSSFLGSAAPQKSIVQCTIATGVDGLSLGLFNAILPTVRKSSTSQGRTAINEDQGWNFTLKFSPAVWREVIIGDTPESKFEMDQPTELPSSQEN